MEKRLLFIAFLFLITSVNFISAESNYSADMNQSVNVLQEELVLPEGLKVFTRVLFGLDPNTGIDISVFIILIVLWIIMFSIIYMVVEFIPMFDNKVKRYIVSFAATCLIAISGSFRDISTFLFDFSRGLDVIGDFSIFVVLLSIVILVLIYLTIRIVMKHVKKLIGTEEAEKAATDLIKTIVDTDKKI